MYKCQFGFSFRELVDSECIDVKIPLQAQVTESQLIILESNTKVPFLHILA